MITRYPEETKWSIWRRQANQNSGKPWRNISGLPFAGPARTTCNAMPLMWKTRNSRGERIPDIFIDQVPFTSWIFQLLKKNAKPPETSLLFLLAIFAYNLKVQFVSEASPMFTKSGDLCIHGIVIRATKRR